VSPAPRGRWLNDRVSAAAGGGSTRDDAHGFDVVLDVYEPLREPIDR
jgi:hypothetical protein